MPQVFTIITDTLWFFLPAAIANITPVLAAYYKWFPSLNKPIDAHKEWGGMRILGNNKTWRGLILGTIAGTIVGVLQGHGLLLGFAISFGALTGDALKSLIKRRSGVNPGESLPVIDQIDYIIGAALGAALITRVPAEHVITAIIIFGTGSAITSYFGYKMHIKKSF